MSLLCKLIFIQRKFYKPQNVRKFMSLLCMWKTWTDSGSHFRGSWLHDTLIFVVMAQIAVSVGIYYLFSSILIVELF